MQLCYASPDPVARRRAVLATALFCGLTFSIVCCESEKTSPQPPVPTVEVQHLSIPAGDRDAFGLFPETVMGSRVSRGAAAGYVSDSTCKDCHEHIWTTYQEVGMARSFYPPDVDKTVETFGETFFHADTKRYYEMTLRDGRYVLQRYCRDADGKRFAEYEAEVAWIIGSGNHVRSYLSQTEHGELYQLPLSWYAADGWAMSPGYERKNHLGFGRRVERACMFCHNAYPEVPAGSDLAHRSHAFPRQLPHGIGCQRCHGPGARHVEAAAELESDLDVIRARIINPKGFTAEKKNQLCMTCHLQPDSLVGEMMPRSFTRPMYSHRPGDRLTDFIRYLDHGSIEERRERIQVNHHAYRLRWSRCHTESGGKLTCVHCHDPHRKVPKAKRVSFYRSKCLQCHQLTDCEMPEMGTTRDPATSDCVGCHMFEARPVDVVHTTITDHLIRRHAPERDLTQRLGETGFSGKEIEIGSYFTEQSAKGPHWKLYEGFGKSNAPTPESLASLRKAFDAARPHTVAGYVDVGRLMIQSGGAVAAVDILRDAVRGFPNMAESHWALGDALLADGRFEAIPHLERARELDRIEPGIHRSLADAYSAAGEFAKARPRYEESLMRRPVNWLTRRQYAYCLLQLDDLDGAIAAFRAAIALRPDDAYAYETISAVHQNRGEWAQAFAVLEQGATLIDATRLALAVKYLLCPNPKFRDHGKGVAHALRVARQSPDNPSGHLHLAFAYLVSEQPKKAAAALEVARSKGADRACCTGLTSLHALAQGNRSEANRLLTQFDQERSEPTEEPLRAELQRFIQSMSGRRR